MIKKSTILAVGLFTIIAAAGCGSKSDTQIVGTWKFKDMQATAASPQDQQHLDAAKAQYAGSSISFSKEKKFDMTVGAKSVMAGSWTLADHDITITPESFQGKSLAQVKAELQQFGSHNPQITKAIDKLSDPIKATLSADGGTVTIMATAGNKGSITYTKASG